MHALMVMPRETDTARRNIIRNLNRTLECSRRASGAARNAHTGRAGNVARDRQILLDCDVTRECALRAIDRQRTRCIHFCGLRDDCRRILSVHRDGFAINDHGRAF